MTQYDPIRPASRYGKETNPTAPRTIAGKWLVIGIVVIIVLAVVMVAWTMRQRQISSDVSASMAGFERINDSTLKMDVDVTRDDVNKPSFCIVTSLDINHAEAGRREIFIPAGGEKTQRISTEIPSAMIPVSGGVYGCSTSIPAHLKG